MKSKAASPISIDSRAEASSFMALDSVFQPWGLYINRVVKPHLWNCSLGRVVLESKVDILSVQWAYTAGVHRMTY